MPRTPNLGLDYIGDSDYLKAAVKDKPNGNMMDLDMLTYAGQVSLSRLTDMANEMHFQLNSLAEDSGGQPAGTVGKVTVAYSTGLPKRLAPSVEGLPSGEDHSNCYAGYFLLIPESVPSFSSGALKFAGYKGNVTGFYSALPGLGQRIYRDTELTLECQWARKVLRIDPNGGTGHADGGWMARVPFPEFEMEPPEGMAFDSLNTQPDGSGDTLMGGELIKGNYDAPIVLYAQWREAFSDAYGVAIRFHENAGDDGSAVVEGMPIVSGSAGIGVEYSGLYHAGHNVRIGEEPSISDGRIFLGWAETATGKPRVLPGGLLRLAEGEEAVDLYALWGTPGQATLTFNKNLSALYTGNVTSWPSNIAKAAGYMVGDVVTLPGTVPKFKYASVTGATFEGWRSSTSATKAYAQPGEDFVFVKASTTLYPLWASDVDFMPNGAEGDVVTLHDIVVTFPECPYEAPEGKRFAFWGASADAASGKAPGDTLATGLGKSATGTRHVYYAIWEDVPEGE